MSTETYTCTYCMHIIPEWVFNCHCASELQRKQHSFMNRLFNCVLLLQRYTFTQLSIQQCQLNNRSQAKGSWSDIVMKAISNPKFTNFYTSLCKIVWRCISTFTYIVHIQLQIQPEHNRGANRYMYKFIPRRLQWKWPWTTRILVFPDDWVSSDLTSCVLKGIVGVRCIHTLSATHSLEPPQDIITRVHIACLANPL
jgi:hypothetical protein